MATESTQLTITRQTQGPRSQARLVPRLRLRRLYHHLARPHPPPNHLAQVLAPRRRLHRRSKRARRPHLPPAPFARRPQAASRGGNGATLRPPRPARPRPVPAPMRHPASLAAARAGEGVGAGSAARGRSSCTRRWWDHGRTVRGQRGTAGGGDGHAAPGTGEQGGRTVRGW